MDKEKLGQKPAFARSRTEAHGKYSVGSVGMSQRLYIATKVTQGILSNPDLRHAILMDSKQKGTNPETLSPEGYLVKCSYEYANELLKQENL